MVRRGGSEHGSGLWYTMPIVDDKHSDMLVFCNCDYPLHLHPCMELRVWFGEDLKNWSENDNQGRVCVDIFAYVIHARGQCWRVSGRRDLTSPVPA